MSIHPVDHEMKDATPPARHDSKMTDGCRVDAASSAVGDESLPNTAEAASQKPFLDTAMIDALAIDHTRQRSSPASAGLQIDTTLASPSVASLPSASAGRDKSSVCELSAETITKTTFASPTSTSFAAMTSSLRSNFSSASLTSSLSPPDSTGSALASPALAAMTDITPLPSPLLNTDHVQNARRQRHGGALSSASLSVDEDRSRLARASSSSSLPVAGNSPRKKKHYGSLVPTALGAAMANFAAQQDTSQETRRHSRNRSISEIIPEPLQNVRQRNVTLGSESADAIGFHMQREVNLAAKRGLEVPATDQTKALPTPPPSNTSVAEDDDIEDDLTALMEDGEPAEYLYVHCGIHHRRRRFRQLRQLGRGTFSKVVLATSEKKVLRKPDPATEHQLDPHRLVAVKLVEHGPAGGADEERIEISLRREVEMLKSVSHPSLIHLKAWEDQSTRTLLVLKYCPGGDLFELAADKRDVIKPALIQRIFSELVAAVRYLHAQWIVHRDIKLENVLVNLTISQLKAIEDPLTWPTPIVTLSDLGLSRRIPQPPESPLLTTRCGSEDYAAPEILLGQPYDGRLTDAWALGVLLYALMEGRLPFDAPPGKPDRSRNTHRIARCVWIWCRFGDDDGEWDSARGGAQYEGARECVEALLKKVRMGRKPLEQIEQFEWVQQGIRLKGGLQMPEDDNDDL